MEPRNRKKKQNNHYELLIWLQIYQLRIKEISKLVKKLVISKEYFYI